MGMCGYVFSLMELPWAIPEIAGPWEPWGLRPNLLLTDIDFCWFASMLVDLWWNICQNSDLYQFYALKSKKALNKKQQKKQPTARKLKVLGCPGFYVLLARRFKGCFTSIPHWVPLILHCFSIGFLGFSIYVLLISIYCLYLAYIKTVIPSSCLKGGTFS